MQCICLMKMLLYLRLVLSSFFFFFLDFDEQTADDWDVDMSIYYDKGISSFLCITLIEEKSQTMN